VARDAIEALAARGQRPDDADVDTPPRLSTRRRQVLELAASGLDVNQIAQTLFLTPGTVRAVLESTSGGES
jgi:DNA-binding NarL/FixJ family response regulator